MSGEDDNSWANASVKSRQLAKQAHIDPGVPPKVEPADAPGKRPALIYLACPYTDTSPDAIAQRFREANRAVGSILTAAKWGETLKALALDLARNPFLAVPALGGIAILFWSRRRMRLLLGRLGKRSEDLATDHFSLTLQSLLLTLLLSMALPLFLAFLGWRVQEGAENSDFIRSVGTALWGIATPLFCLQALCRLCLPGGLAEAHFGWS